MSEAAPRRLDGAAWLARGPLPRLLAALDRDGEEARVIGGAVRNALLGETPHEFDIATTALPETVIARAAASGFKSVPTGIEHGTVTVIVAGTPFEVTTLRQDVETFGRRATVRFGRDWRTDAERRDFTINALSVSRDGTLHDYVGGLADIAVRRVRFIGEARERIREDYLRILRFFRFHAAYGHGAPDPAGLHAAIAERAGLSRLSRERVRMEWMKLLAAAGVVDAVRVMADAGFVGLLLGNVPLVDSLSRLVAIEAQRGIAADPVRRLAALCVVVTEDAERLREQLRLSNAEHERLAAMAQGWWRVGRDLSGRAMRALLFELGPQAFADRVMLAWARGGAVPEDPDWNAALGLPARWAAPRFPVRSADLVARGVPAGPALGAALAEAQSAWIAADFPDDPASFERIAAAAASRHRGRG